MKGMAMVVRNLGDRWTLSPDRCAGNAGMVAAPEENATTVYVAASR